MNLPFGQTNTEANSMTDPNKLILFFGWCTIINFSLLVLTTIILALFKKQVSKIHSMIFGVSEIDILLAYFQYLGNYKIAIILLNLVPYIVLKIIY